MTGCGRCSRSPERRRALAAAAALVAAASVALACAARAQVSTPRSPLGGSLGIEVGPRQPELQRPAPPPIAGPAPADLPPTPIARPAGAPKAEEEVEVRVAFTERRATVVLVWPKPSRVQWNADSREVLLVFDREIAAPALARLQELSGDWFEAVGQGYDSVLLRASRDVAYAVEVKDREVRVTVDAVGAPPVDPVQEKAQAKRQRLLEIELAARTEEPLVARDVVAAFWDEDRSQLPPMLLLAELEQRLGNWQHALELYAMALDKAPDSPDVIAAQAQIRRDRGPELRTDGARQVVNGADTQWIVRQRGRAHPGPRTELGFDWELRDVRTPTVQRLDGTSGPFRGTRQRGEIYVAQQLDDPALTLRGGVLGGSGTAGGTAQIARLEDGGRSAATLEYRKAYWEFVEGLAGGGVRDRFELFHGRPLDQEQRLYGSLALALNRYGVRDKADVASSFTPLVDVAYLVLPARPGVQLSYSIDGEYRFGRADRTTAEGLVYSPIPLPSREVHTVLLTIFGDITDYLRATAYGGYAFDRMNLLSKGPRFGGELIYEPVEDLEVGANYLYSKASGRGSGAVVNRYGLYLLGRF